MAIEPYSYITLAKGKVHRTIEVGPERMWYTPDGKEAGQATAADILIDVDEDGNVLGVEILSAAKICGCWARANKGGGN